MNNADVQVFEFADEATRVSVSDTIALDASRIGNAIPEWVDMPNFWARGRLIVLYVGQDEAVIDSFTRIMGPPIATRSTSGSTDLPEAAEAAVRSLSTSFGIPLDQIEFEFHTDATGASLRQRK